MQPCTYREKNRRTLEPIGPMCGKLPDAGQTMCPRHVLVSQYEKDEYNKEQERRRLQLESERKVKLRAGARR